MGREIKRVALDFDWPLDKVWEGYINPHYRERITCPTCKGDFYSPAGRILNQLWYQRIYDGRTLSYLIRNANIPEAMREWALGKFNNPRPWCDNIDAEDVQALIAANRLWDFTRVARTPEQAEIVKTKRAAGGNSWLPTSNGYVPTPDEVNEWNRRGMGHDSINTWKVTAAKAAKFGVDPYCADCKGEGHVPNPDLEAKIEGWKKTEPPAGDGWQMWETVTEGSPVSPVFTTDQELIDYLVTHEKYSLQSAKAFVSQGWAPSLVSVSGVGVWDGVTYAGITTAAASEHQE